MAVRVLVLSSNRSLRDLVRETLCPLGHEVLLATEMGLAVYLGHKNLPDLIICDSNLDTESPAAFAAEVKADPHLRSIPFCLINRSGERSMHNSTPSDRILSIPQSSDDLLRQIAPYLRERNEYRAPETPE